MIFFVFDKLFLIIIETKTSQTKSYDCNNQNQIKVYNFKGEKSCLFFLYHISGLLEKHGFIIKRFWENVHISKEKR